MRILRKYLKLWWMYTVYATQIGFVSRLGVIIFITGKLLRFFFFLIFLNIIVNRTNALAGYTYWQVIFFFATYNLVDALPQFFMREVYRFRAQISTGAFDFVLTKPFSPIFRALFGGSDVMDLSILLVSVVFIFYSAGNIAGVSVGSVFLYLLLITNSFCVALAFHIFVLSVGVMTTEVDNTIMLYRDLTQMGRFSVDIYTQPLRSILTFVIPVGIMMTFPAKALMNLLSVHLIILSIVVGLLLLWLSMLFWKFAIRHYSSAGN